MPYTPAQQAKLDGAKATLDSAKSAFDSANADANSKYTDLGKCYCGKGKSLTGGHCRPLQTKPAFGELASIGQCKDAPPTNKCTTDCCKESTCISRVNAYNASLSTYNTAKANYDSAQANYDTVLAEVSVELENDPELQSQIASATATANAQAGITRIKWIIFGTLAFLVVGGFVWWKWLRKKAQPAT